MEAFGRFFFGCVYLYPKSKLLNFIYNNGLEDLTFINTRDWEKNPNANTKIKVDAYEFRSLN